MRKLIPGIITMVCLLAVAPAGATILVYQSVPALASSSDDVVRGTVTSVETRWGPSKRSLYTVVSFRVDESLKGSAAVGETLRVTFFGGEKDGIGVFYAGMPRFESGEAAVVFLRRQPDEFCSLVGLSLGKLEIEDGPEGPRVVQRLDGLLFLEPGLEEPASRPDETFSFDDLRELIDSGRTLDRGNVRHDR